MPTNFQIGHIMRMRWVKKSSLDDFLNYNKHEKSVELNWKNTQGQEENSYSLYS